MRAQQVQNLVVVGVLLLFAAGLGVAYWLGGQGSTAGATTSAKPVKKFRADPGTERENAKALTSSVPSVKEETTDRPIEIWGSLDEADTDTSAPPDAPLTPSLEGMSPEEVRNTLLAHLEGDSLTAEERAYAEAALAIALLSATPPDDAGAEAAFARAFAACADADARVMLAYVFAGELSENRQFEASLELMSEGRFAGASISPTRLKLEALRGWVLDALGRRDASRAAYQRAFESVLAGDLHTLRDGQDAARLVALRLSRQYREDGREADAVAVSRMLRAWLNEEDLLLR